ncbi:hypothetical protein GCM10010250_67140 [Streptomyces althioticus]|nr:hypothetical protein GCM10010250_67140 [Streptomyces althioticus]
MRLAGVRSYDERIAREQALEGYRVWLTQELSGDLSKATDVQRLPMTMAPKGFTVDEALALPAKWNAEADERARAEAEREALAEAEAAEREAELKSRSLRRLDGGRLRSIVWPLRPERRRPMRRRRRRRRGRGRSRPRCGRS